MTSREEKIQALKDLQAGKITPEQLPKPEPEQSLWHYNGNEYIKLQPQTKIPHTSGIKLTPNQFEQFVGSNRGTLHIVYDSTGNIEVGNIQPETLDEFKSTKDNPVQCDVMRIGVKLPFGYFVPIKASQLKMYGLI